MANPLKSIINKALFQLSEAEPLALAILGIISGFISALIIIAFRLCIEGSQNLFLPEHAENFEALPTHLQVLLPCLGIFTIALWVHFSPNESRRVGVSHVMDRMSHHQGHFPIRNFINQFVTGAIAVISGQSAGREGAAVHLGAASSGILGSKIKLNNHSTRILIGCGSAAAISASFNTPIAGVIFAMEVVLLEYAISTFIPIILASVIAAIMTRAVFGDNLAFIIPPFEFVSLYELPAVAALAVLIACASALVIKLVEFLSKNTIAWPIWKKYSLAALITVGGILVAPQIMGIGYDTINDALLGSLAFKLLALIAISKILVTASVIGLGLPSGFIGPSLLMGASLGSMVGIGAAYFSPDLHSDIGFYTLLGMCAMMGTTLHAPLAALLAILELTGNPNIILPAMLVIVISHLISVEVFKCHSVFQTLLNTSEQNLQSSSLQNWLNNTRVRDLMDTRFKKLDKIISWSDAEKLILLHKHWILIESELVPKAVISASTLAFHLKRSRNKDGSLIKGIPGNQETENGIMIDLLAIPGEKKDLASISLDASLDLVLETLEQQKVDCLFVVDLVDSASLHNMQNSGFIYGLVMRHHLEHYYKS